MTVARWLARAHAMDEATWARHASPWSVWTRFATLPAILLAVWLHTSIGWGWSLAALLVLAAWTWANPRLFPPPRRTDRWSARAVFGERVWLARRAVPIPPHHARAAVILSVLAGIGGAVALVGAALNDLAATLAGGLLAYLGKMWFLDRMVWLYQDMRDADPAYRAWEHG